jgi:hypothetical protein
MLIVPYLPKGRGELIRSLKKRGEWEHNDKLIEKLPEELDVSAEATKDVLTAIPTVWARPVLFAEALFDKKHPLHKEVTNEWRGLLGIFCFKRVYNFSIDVRGVNLSGEEATKYPFVQILRSSPKPGEEREWNKIYLIYIDNILIGGTSPQTLFFTPPEYSLPERIPWQTEKGVLDDPARYFAENNMKEELGVLKGWVARMKEEIEGKEIKGRFEEWYNEIEKLSPPSPSFEIKPLPGIDEEPYSLIFQYADLSPKERGDFFLNSSRKPGKNIIVIEREEWQKNKNKTLFGSIKVREMIRILDCETDEEIKESFKNSGISCEFIVPERQFFTEKVLRLPLNKRDTIICGSEEYVLPLKNKILDYFTPEEIGRHFQWQKTSDGMLAILNLPLKPDTKGIERTIKIEKLYRRDNIVEEKGKKTPIIALWPNFFANDWYWYYLIVEKTDSEVKYEPVTNTQTEKRDREEIVWHSSKPIEGIVCNYRGIPCGLILPKLSELKTDTTDEWHVGVDFGTSNTSVAYKVGETGTPTILKFQDRTLKLTQCPIEAVRDFLIHRFMPFWEKEGESLTSIVRILGSGASPEMVLDGILLHLLNHPSWPAIICSEVYNIKAGLKWSPEQNERDCIIPFLKHLVLLILAEARARGVKKFIFYSSYPSAFKDDWKVDLKGNWENTILQSFRRGDLTIGTFGERNFQTESVAACKYWVGKGGDIGKTLPACVVDIGGGTTDIGIWMRTDGKAELKAQASVRLAGGIIGDLALKRKEFYRALINLVEESLQAKFLTDLQLISEIEKKEVNIPALINIILRRKEEREILSEVRRQATDKNTFKKARTLIAFAYGGLIYYLGLLLREINRTLPEEEKIKGCDIYFAGNGSKLLKWVSLDEDLLKFIRAVILESGNLEKPDLINFHYSEKPKQEVSQGLLVPEEVSIPSPIKIIGESGYSYKGSSLEWNRDMANMVKKIINFSEIKVPTEFPELENYIKIYNTHATGCLNVEEVKGYQAELIKNALESRIGKNVDIELLQPFFIEEIKVVIDKYLL